MWRLIFKFESTFCDSPSLFTLSVFICLSNILSMFRFIILLILTPLVTGAGNWIQKWESIVTNFLVDKPEILKWPPLVSQPSGSAFYLICNAIRGSKPLRFRWFKNGIQITSGSNPDRFTIESKLSVSHLHLPEIIPGDTGNYSCSVENRFGIDAQWSLLEVKGLCWWFEFISKCGASISILHWG